MRHAYYYYGGDYIRKGVCVLTYTKGTSDTKGTSEAPAIQSVSKSKYGIL